MVHGDINEMNILVDENGTKVTGVIDFGDSSVKKRFCNVAIPLCYYILYSDEPLRCAANFLSGYLESVQLLDEEMKLLFVRIDY